MIKSYGQVKTKETIKKIPLLVCEGIQSTRVIQTEPSAIRVGLCREYVDHGLRKVSVTEEI